MKKVICATALAALIATPAMADSTTTTDKKMLAPQVSQNTVALDAVSAGTAGGSLVPVLIMTTMFIAAASAKPTRTLKKPAIPLCAISGPQVPCPF